jgi:hypothetical protein
MAGQAITSPATAGTASLAQRIGGSRYTAVGVAIALVWLSVLIASVITPNMISGSNHEQLAVGPIFDWIWGSMATALLLLAASFARREHASVWWVVTLMLGVIWIAAAPASGLSPTMVTATDPTTIPLAAMLAPIAAMVATAFLSVFAAGGGAAEGLTDPA